MSAKPASADDRAAEHPGATHAPARVVRSESRPASGFANSANSAPTPRIMPRLAVASSGVAEMCCTLNAIETMIGVSSAR